MALFLGIRRPITTSLAPSVSPDSISVVSPERRCCKCCEPPCATPDDHTDPCTLLVHQPDGAA